MSMSRRLSKSVAELKLRYDVVGVPQHVIQRGVNRQRTFFSRRDCHRYLGWLGRAAHEGDLLLRRGAEHGDREVRASLRRLRGRLEHARGAVQLAGPNRGLERFEVRLARVTYIDTEKKDTITQRWAFVQEQDEPFASRIREHLDSRPNLRTGAGTDSPWMFPSTLAGRHLHPNTVSKIVSRLARQRFFLVSVD